MTIRYYLRGAAAIGSTVLACGQAMSADPDREDKLETIVVTGQRLRTSLEQNASSGALGTRKLLDTPFSMTVVNADEITRRQVNSVAQLFVNDPSIFSAAPSATTAWWGIQVRGLGVHNYFVDGVPIMMSWGGEFPLEAVERVEVLKGLTGFMYGFGQPGGAINYETKKPTEQSVAMTGFEYRNDGQMFAQLDAGGRLGAERGFGYRTNLAGEFGEGYNGADANRGLASLAVDYRFSPDLEWFANATYEDSDLKHEPLHLYWDLYEGERLPRAIDDYENVSVRNSFYRYDTLIGSTGLTWRVNDAWRAQFTYGHASQDHQSNRMFADMLNEAGDYAGYAYNFAGLLKSYISQALVQGSLETGAIRHELVFGASYRRDTTQWSNDWHYSNDFDGNIRQPQPFLVSRAIDFSLAPISGDDRQSAAFASDTLHFGDRWQALIGLRYTDFEMLDRDGDSTFDSSYQTDAVSPTYALIFKPSPHASIYGSFVEAMEGGSRVGPEYANAGELLGATVSKQYEFGVKYERGPLHLTTAAFRVERAAQMDELRAGLRYLTQDGQTVYDGIEFVADFDVSEQLTLSGGATFLDAGIENVSEENADVAGNTPAGAAQWQAVAGVDYRFAKVQGLSLYANARYYDEAYYDDVNRILIPNRTLASAGMQYQTTIAGRRTVITGSINNLFDELYWELNSFGEGRNAALGVQVLW